MKKAFVSIFLSGLLMLLALTESFSQIPREGASEVPASSKATISTTEESGLISVGDKLDIRVFNRPQLSRESVKVDERGEIKMPFLDQPIQAVCQSERALADEITARYRELVRSPQVEVIIKEYASQPFAAVIGAVRSPSRLQMQKGKQIRLLDALAFVGGPTEKAGKKIQVIRGVKSVSCSAPNLPDSDEKIADKINSYDLKSALGGESAANPFIKEGDIVVLPEADQIQIFVTGNVLKPSTLTLSERITITQAIAMSGGFMPDTDREKIRILRQEPGSTAKREIIINIKSKNSEDVLLQANDILDIPVNGGKRMFRTFLGAIVPSVAQLPVRVIP